jgi:hypothetical protein
MSFRLKRLTTGIKIVLMSDLVKRRKVLIELRKKANKARSLVAVRENTFWKA